MEGDLPEHAGAGNETAETTGKAQQHRVLRCRKDLHSLPEQICKLGHGVMSVPVNENQTSPAF